MNRRLLCCVLSLSVGCVLMMGCQISPSGRDRLLLHSPQQLSAVGQRQFEALKQQAIQQDRLDRNPTHQRRVACVVDALNRTLPGGQRWRFMILRDSSANAFAMPGGYLGVHSGLLDVATTADQLATVMAHEMAHVLAQHSNEQASMETLVQGGLMAASILGGLSPQNVQHLGMGAQYGLLRPYSRRHEQEADRMGLMIMAKADFDPAAAVTLWRKMQPSRMPVYLSTHPSNQQRIADLKRLQWVVQPVFRQAREQGYRPNC